MCRLKSTLRHNRGFSLIELVLVMGGGLILVASAVPIVDTVLDQYRVRLSAQSIVTELQFARMKAVSSNESFQVNFSPGQQREYQVETSTGSVIAGPFRLPQGIDWNVTDPGGTGLEFPGHLVSFLPTGNVPVGGNGSAGRVRIVSRTGVRIDIIVTTGGTIRQTPPYKSPPAPF